MADRSGIQWPDRTVMRFTEADGTPRARVYRRVRTDRPGAAERRRQRLAGLAWCRGCAAWLPVAEVDRRGACQPCLNAEYRAAYAGRAGDAIRSAKSARKRGLDPIPAWWREENLTGSCLYGCGRPAEGLDHVWPVARGGRSDPGNLVPCCATCNSRKRDALPGPWVERGFAAFPEQWENLYALAVWHNVEEWAA